MILNSRWVTFLRSLFLIFQEFFTSFQFSSPNFAHSTMAASRNDCTGYRDNDVVIVSAARTPVGSLNGDLSSLKAHELGCVVIREVLSRCKLDGCDVDEVILGQVLTAGKGCK